MTGHQRDRITLHGAQGLFAVIPVLLGFRPEDSLVLVCLRRPGGTVGQVARVDVSAEPAAAAHLADFAARHADAVAVVCYSPLRRPSLLVQLERELSAAGVPVVGAWTVHDGWASAAGHRDAPPFPVDLEETPAVVHLRAVTALAGRAVLPSRRHLVESIAPPMGEAARRARSTLTRVAGEPAPEADVVATQALEECSVSGSVDLLTAARLVRAIGDIPTRDALVARAVRETDRPWVAMLVSAAGQTPGSAAAPLCAVLSLIAYRHGDGALAQVAAQRCLDHDPGHSLGRIMVDVMARGLPPERLATLTGPADPEDQPAADRKGVRTSVTDSRCTKASAASTGVSSPVAGSTET